MFPIVVASARQKTWDSTVESAALLVPLSQEQRTGHEHEDHTAGSQMFLHGQ